MTEKQVNLSIIMELERAKEIHPEWPADIVHQMAIVCEEAGEVLEEAHPYLYGKNNKTHMIKELTQTAAMVYRFLESHGFDIDIIERTLNKVDYNHLYKINESVTIANTALKALKATLDHYYHGKPLGSVINHVVRLGKVTVGLLNRLTID